MAKLVFTMNLSLDGYVDHQAFPPGRLLFRHFTEEMRNLTGCIYGRGLYDIMRYWDQDDAGWGADGWDFAKAWRRQPKWVVSRTLDWVGPNARLVTGDLATAIIDLKQRHDGEIEVGGPALAHSLGDLGLIDEYRLYFRPVVLGHGNPFFAGPLPSLRFIGSETIGEDAVRLSYVPVGNA